MTVEDRRVAELREALQIGPDEATDEEILKLTEGSLLRAGVEARQAARVFAAPLLDLSKRLLEKIGKPPESKP